MSLNNNLTETNLYLSNLFMKKEFSKQYYVEVNGVATIGINISIDGYTPIAISQVTSGEGYIALSTFTLNSNGTSVTLQVRNLWNDPLTRICKVVILYAKNIA